MNQKVYVFLAEGFEEVEALTPVDVLRRAGLDVKIVSTTGKKEVQGAHHITVVSDGLFDDFDYTNADLLVLPGGMPGATNLSQHKKLIQCLNQHNQKGKWLGAICAAPFVLGQHGILDNHLATCYPGFEDQLKGAKVTGNNVEVSGNIVTGRGVGVAMDFALELAARLVGQEKANDLSKKMVVSN